LDELMTSLSGGRGDTLKAIESRRSMPTGCGENQAERNRRRRGGALDVTTYDASLRCNFAILEL